ncbi:hypothetical protein SEA_GENAMY16_57 [Gordonia phage Genamy16]|uniref:Uncharacterized protein n=2 Tax=Lambovirus TaxID=2843412 RepID=A0A9E7Q5Y9_9CAUD|nr:hypothetical protein SEA_GENAMY16_57 [Gordonia phage Genamy16]UVF61761.1 hypothetical protein SEA_NOVASHARKS_56 [Gordonia phage NovaSharks]UVK63138.1 hypothetical protein SEA_RUMI_55 [Gordonia phage Rumi]WNM65361.1 hypothetical protein SEA_ALYSSAMIRACLE_57 [Gordonia phage Alyssamiracle]
MSNITNEVSLTCDGPRCHEKIIWDGDISGPDDLYSDWLSDQMRKSAIASGWYIVDQEVLMEDGYYYAFHNVACLKRYFREHAKTR